MTVMIIVTAPNAGKYAQKHGSRIPMTYGLLLAGGGLLALSRIDVTTSYWILLPIFMIMGHGMGATMAPMTAAVMNAVGHQRAGLGSAMTNTSREVGGVFGIALLGTILTTQLRSAIEPALSGLGLPAGQRAAIAEAAGHGALDRSVLTGLTPEQLNGVRQAFAESFMSGFRISLVVGGVVLLIAALVANRFIPGREAHAEDMERHTARDRVAEPVMEF
jgi:MFS family permease